MPTDKIANTIFGIPGGIFALGAIVVVSIILLVIRQSKLKKTVVEMVAPLAVETGNQSIMLEEVAAISAVMAIYFEEIAPEIDFVVSKVTRISDNSSWGQIGQIQNTQSL